jgi:hypothetical protein
LIIVCFRRAEVRTPRAEIRFHSDEITISESRGANAERRKTISESGRKNAEIQKTILENLDLNLISAFGLPALGPPKSIITSNNNIYSLSNH